MRPTAPGTRLTAYVLLGLGRHQQALDLLEPACAARAGLLVSLEVDPVRGDGCFLRLLEQGRVAD